MTLNIPGNNHRMLCRQSSSSQLYNLVWLHSPGNQSYVNKLSQWLQGLAQLAVCSGCRCAALRSQSSSAPAQQICPDRSTSACSSQPFCCMQFQGTHSTEFFTPSSTSKSGRINQKVWSPVIPMHSFGILSHPDQARKNSSSEGLLRVNVAMGKG